MEANELRIGNWVFLQELGEKETTRVDIELLNRIFNDEYYNGSPILKPIPLTPEILEQCGGYNQSNNEKFACYVINIGGEDDLAILFPFDYGDDYTEEELKPHLTCRGADAALVIELEYLHQLQNLFHSLTGKELEIKELVW